LILTTTPQGGTVVLVRLSVRSANGVQGVFALGAAAPAVPNN
jgi:hypothetical protein